MRKIFTSFLLLSWSIIGFASTWMEIGSPVPTPAKVTMVSSTIDRSVVQLTLEGFSLREVQTPNGTAFSVEVGNSTPILEAGAPDLPKLTASLVIPDMAGMGIRVLSSSFRDYTDILVAPSKGVIMRDKDPSMVPYSYGNVYAQDKFYPGTMCDTREPYIIRDVRGQTMIVYPFQYNPVTRVLRVYHDMTVELYKTSETGINTLAQPVGVKQIPADFLSVYKNQFSNFDAITYTPLAEYGNLLVICYGTFMDAMQPFVNWKRAEGYQTEMIDKDSVGATAAEIKTFIADYYNTKGLTHVLLVGDGPQIPTNTGSGLGGPSDNAYGYVVGNDHYADVFIGRFSAENVAQVETQVTRTLDYEQNPQFLTDDWYTSVIGIASDQGPGDDGEMDYQHIRNQQTKLLNYTYTWNPELFDGSQGGNDATGNPTPPMVATEVNNGSSLILYTGHGSKTSWGSSGFSNTNVNQLTNPGMLPFIWSVACVNGEFMTGGPCFAEAWMRASQSGEPTGAIAFLGSTINQSWNSPMEGQDAMTDILIESDSTNIKRTFAGLSINGCMKMIDSYGTDGRNMADTWTIFGDPTVMVRTAAPELLTVIHGTTMMVGDSLFSMTSPVDGARGTLTVADTILATGVFMNNSLELAFPPLTTPNDTVNLVVTAYNNIPYMSSLVVEDGIILPAVAGFTGIPEHVLPGETVSFSDTSAGTVKWREWVFPGGTPAISREKNPVITYHERGTYDVQLIVGNSLMRDTLVKTGYILCDFATSASELSANVSVTVMPNPNNGIFELRISSPGDEIMDINLINMVGANVYSSSGITGNGIFNQSIDLHHLPAGLYFMQVKSKDTSITKKIVIR